MGMVLIPLLVAGFIVGYGVSPEFKAGVDRTTAEIGKQLDKLPIKPNDTETWIDDKN